MLANTKLQPLTVHSAAIGLLTQQLYRYIYPNDEAADRLNELLFWAGALHDIGKIDPHFQEYIQQKIQQSKAQEDDDNGAHIDEHHKTYAPSQYPRHNEISWALLSIWLKKDEMSKDLHWDLDYVIANRLLYSVYWHHAKPLRNENDDEFQNVDKLHKKAPHLINKNETTRAILLSFMQDTAQLAQKTFNPNWLAQHPEISPLPIPNYKYFYSEQLAHVDDFGEVKKLIIGEARNSAIRAALITADRYISSLSVEELQSTLELLRDGFFDISTILNHTFGLTDEIEEGLSRFQTNMVRNQEQENAARACATSTFSILQGPAGCGKTKVMLHFIANQQKKTILITPRVAIAEGLFEELNETYGLRNNVEILTGTKREKLINNQRTNIEDRPTEWLSSDIVITTIDQLTGILLSHRHINVLIDLMTRNFIVDEYHELFDIPGIVLIFLELMQHRAWNTTSKTLLVSATPNQYFQEMIQKMYVYQKPNVQKLPTHNTKPIHVHTLEIKDEKEYPHPLQKGIKEGDIAIFNQVGIAQRLAIQDARNNKYVICGHSKFTPTDKKNVLSKIKQIFGEASTSYTHALYSGPIIQASLNIATKHLYTDITNAENFLQRIGRLNRFGKFDHSDLTYLVHIDRHGTRPSNILNKFANYNRSYTWLKWLEKQAYTQVTLKDLYTSYNDYQQDEKTKKAYNDDFLIIIQKGIDLFRKKSFDPIQYPKPKTTKKKEVLSNRSLRGDSYYILPKRVQEQSGKQLPKTWLTENADAQLLYTDNLQWLTYLQTDTQRGRYIDQWRDDRRKLELAELKGFSNLSKMINKKRGITLWKWKMAARSTDMPFIPTVEHYQKYEVPSYVYFECEGTVIGFVHEDYTQPSTDVYEIEDFNQEN